MKSRILVVDDEKDLVNLLRYNLEKEGFEVDCAYNGSSVQGKVFAGMPDLIILDLMLPDRRLRYLPGFKGQRTDPGHPHHYAHRAFV
jgi:DNA-binding response OmpR family regulator